MASALEPLVEKDTSGASALSAKTLVSERSPSPATAGVCGSILSGRPAKAKAEDTPPAEEDDDAKEGPLAEEPNSEGAKDEEPKEREEVEDEVIRPIAEVTPP